MIDIVRIKLFSGSGGNGCVSFRREKFVPKGGPDGGDGGDGGSVYIEGNHSINTLLHISYYSFLKASPGKHGGANRRTGARGGSLVVQVPLGTSVWTGVDYDDRILVGDILDETKQLLCKGGRGGRGNGRFATPVNQTPLLAEAGDPGTQVNIILELKLLADVGIVGMPNAGKSTLLSASSAAKPKVADYPFTTIDPILGMVEYTKDRFLLVEVPGLIEGAHKGAGLGQTFLRHAERTRLIWHLVDGTVEDVVGRIAKINEELRQFNPDLLKKPQIIIINKMDMPDAEANIERIKDELKTMPMPVFYVSAVTRKGLKTLISKTVELLSAIPKEPASSDGDDSTRIVLPLKARAPEIWKEGDVYMVDSPKVNKLVSIANLRDSRVRIQLWRELERMGITRALEKEGVKSGDTVRLGKIETEWE